MGTRKRKEYPNTLMHRGRRSRRRDEERVRELEEEIGGEEREKGGSGRFFACYLLASLSPRHKGHTYIGFTVNPRRRIRQHNGEIKCGAKKTKSKRPWEMVLCIYGFPTNVAALQFEWAWQHPVESLAVREAATAFKSLSGLANKIKLAYTMLTLPAWQSLKLTVNFISTKYQKHIAGCPSLPENMNFIVCSMDELPCYSGSDWNAYENDQWDDDEECNDVVGFQGPIIEGLLHGTIHYSVDDQNSIPENTHKRIGLMEESTNKQAEGFEEFGGLQGSIIEGSLYKTNDKSGDNQNGIEESSREQIGWMEETVANREMFRLIEDYNFELDQPTSYLHAIKRPSVPCDSEVIDLFTPSPRNKINSVSKKRRFSSVCQEIIDLTKSPIFN